MRPALDISSLTLRELADHVKAGHLTCEQVALEYDARKRAGLDPDSGRAPEPVPAPHPLTPARWACPTCGRAGGPPIANHEVP